MADRKPEQLTLAIEVPPAAPRPAGEGRVQKPASRRAAARDDQLELRLPAPRKPIAVIDGGGTGTGHRRARLVAIEGGVAPSRPLPSRDEITTALLGALADLVAGRISATAASAIREAAEDALRQLDAAERDPHRTAQFVRAARALQELL